jgi:preprotein translocase subunit SecG
MVVLNIFHVLIAIAMVALVLVQRGAGATAGAAFGSGASGTVFGARGAGTFLTKSTWVLATLFCAISLTIAVLVSRTDTSPQTSLGVVASTPAADQQATQATAVEDQSGQQVDLPALQISEDPAASDGAQQQEQAADDLPALDGGAVESTEVQRATEDNQGAAANGSDSDDS